MQMRRETEKKSSGVSRYVLDTFAVQVFLAGEPGVKIVQDVLGRAASGQAHVYVSWVSLSEIYYVVYRKAGQLRAKTTLEGIKRLSIEILHAGESECLEAGDIKARFKLSLADAFVAALGKLYDAQILTGDPEFKPLEEVGEIRVLWLPQK